MWKSFSGIFGFFFFFSNQRRLGTASVLGLADAEVREEKLQLAAGGKTQRGECGVHNKGF